MTISTTRGVWTSNDGGNSWPDSLRARKRRMKKNLSRTSRALKRQAEGIGMTKTDMRKTARTPDGRLPEAKVVAAE